ncbi:MAG: tetratricopeptide repeat protein, partial [Thermoanaerobaculia bacterium]|nr:tetratricopeptide repeat protein [Thermoanaerobaculia bacterium]
VGVILASLSAGSVAAAVGYLNARRSETRALAAQEETAAVNEFLREVLASPRPTESGREVKVVEVLEQAAGVLDQRFEAQPRVRAATRLILGRSYEAMGDPVAAEPLLSTARDEFGRLVGPGAADTIVASAYLGRALADQQRLDEADAILREALVQAQTAGDPEILIEVQRARYLVAFHGEDFEAAERRLQEIFDTIPPDTPDFEPTRKVAELDLVNLLNARGELQRAEALAREVLDWSLGYNGPRHGNTLAARHHLAIALDRQGRYAESGALFVENYETARSWLGIADRYTMNALAGVASNLTLQGRGDEAQDYLELLVDVTHEVYGDEHEITLVAATNLSTQLRENGDFTGAETLLRDTLDRVEATHGPQHRLAHINRFNLAELLFLRGRYADAAAVAETARRSMHATLGEEHLFTLVTDAVLGASLALVGDSGGEELLRATVDRERKVLGPTHPNTLDGRTLLALVVYEKGDRTTALGLLEEVLAESRDVLGADHPQTLKAAELLASWR